MLCMTSSTSVHLDRSCGDLAHRCLYLLDKQSRIFCKDYPSLLRSEVFSCLPAQTTKINPLQRGSVIAAEAALARPSPKWSNKKVCIPYRNQRQLVWTDWFGLSYGNTVPANTSSEGFPELLVQRRGWGEKHFLDSFVTIAFLKKSCASKHCLYPGVLSDKTFIKNEAFPT